MIRLVAIFSLMLAVLIGSTGVSYALPDCPASPATSFHFIKTWNNCFGTFFTDTKQGSKYVGEWKNGKYHGKGTYYSAPGVPYQAGIWKNDNFQYEKTIPKRQLKKSSTKKTRNEARKAQRSKKSYAKLKKCMFDNVKKVTNSIQYGIIYEECRRRANR